MKLCGIVALLLAAGCATTRVVNLDTGQGTPIGSPDKTLGSRSLLRPEGWLTVLGGSRWPGRMRG